MFPRTRRCCRLLPLLALLLCATPLLGADDDDLLAELDAAVAVSDLHLLNHSHLTFFQNWTGARGLRQRNDAQPDGSPWTWRVTGVDGEVAPLTGGPLTSVMDVPKAGTYRLWLRYEARREHPRPVELTLSGSNAARHTFAAKGITSQAGKTQEANTPVRFETEAQRMGTPGATCVVWEFVDLPLKAGSTDLSLRSSAKDARIFALFVSQSRSFRPSLAPPVAGGNLNRVYVRLCFPGAANSRPLKVQTDLTYHWRRIPRGATGPLWYSTLTDQPITGADKRPLQPGEWSAWIDATDSLTGGGSPWATLILRTGAPADSPPDGEVQVQLAWHPHDAAILKTIAPALRSGVAWALVPVQNPEAATVWATPQAEEEETESTAVDEAAPAPGKTLRFGVRSANHVALLRTPLDVAAEQRALAEAALTALHTPSEETPRRLILTSGANTAAEAREDTLAMLARLGINHIEVADAAQRERYHLHDDLTVHAADALFHADTHCPLDPRVEQVLRDAFSRRAQQLVRQHGEGAVQRVTLMKMGDEIGPIVNPAHIRRCTDCRRAFAQYVRQTLAEHHEAMLAALEQVNPGDVPYCPNESVGSGPLSSAAHLLSQRFQFIFTARFYARVTAAAQAVFPNVRTYCNFSPHPPMFGGDMNGSDWFALTRHGGATHAWAEDWASRGGTWGMAGIETVSYYAALVRSAGNFGQLPQGFYSVATTGASDYKFFSLVAHDIHRILVYSFGPLYAGAEYSNFWSQMPGAYQQIARGTRALGPVDRYLVEGKRQLPGVALLYNRSHEIQHGPVAGVQSDRLLSFIALQQAHRQCDIVLEEDLTPEVLSRYRMLVLFGWNLDPACLPALTQWVQAGGTLVGVAGAAQYDLFDQPHAPAAELFGATQQLIAISQGGWHALQMPQHQPVGEVTLHASEVTPALSAPIVGPLFHLKPTTGQPVGQYADGAVAAVRRAVGQGHTLLLGFSPGLVFKGDADGNSTYRLDRRVLFSVPADTALGPPAVAHTAPQTELALFEHPDALVVTVNQFAFTGAGEPGVLTVRTTRPIKEVFSTLTGPLPFTRQDDVVRIEHAIPQSVDAVVLR